TVAGALSDHALEGIETDHRLRAVTGERRSLQSWWKGEQIVFVAGDLQRITGLPVCDVLGDNRLNELALVATRFTAIEAHETVDPSGVGCLLDGCGILHGDPPASRYAWCIVRRRKND